VVLQVDYLLQQEDVVGVVLQVDYLLQQEEEEVAVLDPKEEQEQLQVVVGVLDCAVVTLTMPMSLRMLRCHSRHVLCSSSITEGG
jgi:hypothetical protein